MGLGCGSQGDWLWTGLKRVFLSLGMGTKEDKAQPGHKVSLNRNQTRKGRRGTKADT